MSMEYCWECDRLIDLDYDSDHEHFSEEFLKGGKENGKNN